jgi:hypothetical protein
VLLCANTSRCNAENCLKLTAVYESSKYDSILLVPFDVVCTHCKAVQQFGGYPVILMQVEQPIENLPDLPEFR